jgi:hypothetical protein
MYIYRKREILYVPFNEMQQCNYIMWRYVVSKCCCRPRGDPKATALEQFIAPDHVDID